MRVRTIHLGRFLKEGAKRRFRFLLLAGCIACVPLLQACTSSAGEPPQTEPSPASEDSVQPYDRPVIDAADVLVNYPVNAYGETYGGLNDVPEGISGEYEDFVGMYPDLIRVEATNGAVGYVKKDKFFKPPPATSEEAVRLQKVKVRNGVPPLTVYDVDGRTVVGEFEIG